MCIRDSIIFTPFGYRFISIPWPLQSRFFIRENIFNIISHSNLLNINLNKSNILDLYSGVGSFGIECLSREAKKVIFLENYSEALKVLEKNLRMFFNLYRRKGKKN